MVKTAVSRPADGDAVPVDVYVVDTAPVDDGWLDVHERARAARFLRATDRQTFVAAHVALRFVVGRALDRDPARVRFGVEPCPLCGGEHGRPTIIAGDGLQFSLSHTTDRSAIALAPSVVGVDLERADRAIDAGDLTVMLHPNETTPVDQFAALRHWVRKEAYLKALGTGLGLDPRSVDLSSDPPGWQLIDLDVAPYIGAIAINTEGRVALTHHDLDIGVVADAV